MPLLAKHSKFWYFFFKKNFMASFYGWGSTASRLEPLHGRSLLFTTKFPEIPVIHFIYWPQKDGRLVKTWSHLVVLNTGPLDWESSSLTTRPLFHQGVIHKGYPHKFGNFWDPPPPVQACPHLVDHPPLPLSRPVHIWLTTPLYVRTQGWHYLKHCDLWTVHTEG